MYTFLELLTWFISAYIIIRIYKACWIMGKSLLVHYILPQYSLDHLKNSWTGINNFVPFKRSFLVCTGATDGIGKAYVFELARTRGIRKFYLLGRNANKLDAVKSELSWLSLIFMQLDKL